MRDVGGEVSAPRGALRIDRGDEWLIEESILSHGQRHAVAVRATLRPLSRCVQARAGDVRIAVFDARESVARVAAAKHNRNLVHRFDHETHAVSAVALRTYGR